jgi:hypothetical protein
LVEKNVFKNTLAGAPTGFVTKPMSLKLEGTGQIFRKNFVYNNKQHAIGGGVRVGADPALGMTEAKVYNNVFYNNGQLFKFSDRGRDAPIGTDLNIFKNNIDYASNLTPLVDVGIVATSRVAGNNPLNEHVYSHNSFKRLNGGITIKYTGIGTNTLNWWANNYPANFSGNLEVAPDFVASNPSKPADFRLKSSSPLINAGASLTNTRSSGSGTSVPVDDAGYFSDGFGVIEGDEVVIGNNSPVRITDVNYNTNTITVARSISWNNNDSINLPYSGSAPDIGAFEQ